MCIYIDRDTYIHVVISIYFHLKSQNSSLKIGEFKQQCYLKSCSEKKNNLRISTLNV